jgi:hypothetical protein
LTAAAAAHLGKLFPLLSIPRNWGLEKLGTSGDGSLMDVSGYP